MSEKYVITKMRVLESDECFSCQKRFEYGDVTEPEAFYGGIVIQHEDCKDPQGKNL